MAVETAVVVVVVTWISCLLIVATVAAVCIAAKEILGAIGRDRNATSTWRLRRIGAETREAIDRVSEAYLSEVETLCNHYPRR